MPNVLILIYIQMFSSQNLIIYIFYFFLSEYTVCYMKYVIHQLYVKISKIPHFYGILQAIDCMESEKLQLFCYTALTVVPSCSK